MFNSENFVRTAVDRIGGPTRTATLVAVSNATIHAWLKNGRIPNIDKARAVANAAEMDVQMLRGTR
jgi:predicted site-specific integrase-resolvase